TKLVKCGRVTSRTFGLPVIRMNLRVEIEYYGSMVYWGLLKHGELCLKMYAVRSEEHTSELQSPCNLVCRLLLEKKKKKTKNKKRKKKKNENNNQIKKIKNIKQEQNTTLQNSYQSLKRTNREIINNHDKSNYINI